MRFEGTVAIGAPIERTWRFLTDPHQASACAPGLQSVEVLEPQRFKMIVRTGVGPIKGTFAFDVRFEELRVPEHAVVRARGQMPGSVVDMVSTMELSRADHERTTMRWSSEVTVSGTIASVGARLLQGVADKTVQQVFACVKEKLEAPASTPA